MNIPSIILGFVISTLLGAIFHFWKDGGPVRLLFYLCLGWAGFLLGQYTATRLGWDFDAVGSIHAVTASVNSVLFLIIGHWLSLIQVDRK